MAVIFMTAKVLQQVNRQIVSFDIFVSCTGKVAKMNTYDTLFVYDHQVEDPAMFFVYGIDSSLKKRIDDFPFEEG